MWLLASARWTLPEQNAIIGCVCLCVCVRDGGKRDGDGDKGMTICMLV